MESCDYNRYDDEKSERSDEVIGGENIQIQIEDDFIVQDEKHKTHGSYLGVKVTSKKD